MAYSKRLFSPLRYPGGKARLSKFVTELIDRNKLRPCHYVEPFAGGAGVALDLLYSGTADYVHINDVDPAVHAFWLAAVSHSDELLELVDKTPVTINEWHRWRSVATEPESHSAAEVGYATLFLNRTNRSGILAAGPIGGKDQAGSYRLDARFDSKMIAGRLQKISDHKERIVVSSDDAAQLLERLPIELRDSTQFWYLDPPYYVKGQGLYRNAYEEADHAGLAAQIQKSKLIENWIVSYDDARPIAELYQNRRVLRYRLSYSAHEKYSGREIIAFSDNLRAYGRNLLPGPSSAPRRRTSRALSST